MMRGGSIHARGRKNLDIKAYETPYKYGKPVLSGSGRPHAFDEKGVDIPFVFMHQGRYYMMYTGYDGIGYQTALAVSNDLVSWTFYSMVLERGKGSHGWDDVSAAATWIIKDSDNLYDTPVLKKIEGKYWLVYHAYPGKGYEEGAAAIGMAWCDREDLKEWHRLENPVFKCSDGRAWEAGGLYKACIIRDQGLWYMFYNAKDTQPRWIEQTGAAVSEDLRHWERLGNGPLLCVSPGSWNGRFVSDPYIVKDGTLWLNFYFGYDQGHAQEGLAISEDLIHWEKVKRPLIPHGNAREIDENHAHKASIFYKDGVLYHFYCATRPNRENDPTSLYGELRTITVAASRPWEEILTDQSETKGEQ